MEVYFSIVKSINYTKRQKSPKHSALEEPLGKKSIFSQFIALLVPCSWTTFLVTSLWQQARQWRDSSFTKQSPQWMDLRREGVAWCHPPGLFTSLPPSRYSSLSFFFSCGKVYLQAVFEAVHFCCCVLST